MTDKIEADMQAYWRQLRNTIMILLGAGWSNEQIGRLTVGELTSLVKLVVANDGYIAADFNLLFNHAVLAGI